MIGDIALGDEAAKSKDILGRVYEYFLGEFAAAEGKKGGQFYTPKSIVKLLVEMIEPYKGRVYDPCCGSGGMFVMSEKFIKEHQGKVIVGGSGVTGEAYQRALEVGVKGIVVGGLDVEDLIEILGEDIGVAITGEENIDITVIATEGFGALPISERTFNLLRNMEGRMSAINGTTQIRAGVLRPEIIIPYDNPDEMKESKEEFSDGMIKGSLVRIIRAPYFGEIAKVTDLPINLQRVESGSKVRVIELELEDGKAVTVPRANVEIIEE